MTAPLTKEILARGRDGDRHAQSLVTAAFQDRVNAIARATKSRYTETDDLKQVGHLAVLAALERYEDTWEPEAFRAYAESCIRTHMADEIRQSAPLSPTPHAWRHGLTVAEDGTPYATVPYEDHFTDTAAEDDLLANPIRQQQQQAIQAAIADLPPRQREILCYFYGWPPAHRPHTREEVAALYEPYSKSAISEALARGREALRTHPAILLHWPHGLSLQG